MKSKIVIEVFGIKNESAGGGDCGPGCCGPGSCGPAPTMGEMFQDFVNFIEKSEVKDKVTLRFIDVMEDNLDEYESVKKVLAQGYGLPLTVINGNARFYGGLSIEMIHEEIKKM